MTLFREEAIRNAHGKLYGDVNLAVPVSWQALGYLLAAMLVVAGAFLATATYARIETVPGTIAPAQGLAAVAPVRAGVITAVHVNDGAIVRQGDALVSIDLGERGSDGSDPQEQIAAALRRQSDSIETQSRATISAAAQEVQRLREETPSLEQQAESIEDQIVLQKSLIDSAQRDIERIRAMLDSGFLSRRDLQGPEEALIAKRQNLAALQQSKSANALAVSRSRYALAKLEEDVRIELSRLSASRAEVVREEANLNGSRAYTLVSPVNGRVTALVARVGQPAAAGGVLLAVVPENSKLQAELYVPSTAIGFITVGQDVRLAIDAFPYERFGTLTARVSEVSTAPATVARPTSAATLSTYLAAAELSTASVDVYGRRAALLPGMTLSARITTDRRSLFQWLLPPVLVTRQP